MSKQSSHKSIKSTDRAAKQASMQAALRQQPRVNLFSELTLKIWRSLQLRDNLPNPAYKDWLGGCPGQLSGQPLRPVWDAERPQRMPLPAEASLAGPVVGKTWAENPPGGGSSVAMTLSALDHIRYGGRSIDDY